MYQKLIQLGCDDYTNRRHKEVLSHIREKYGNTTQILVSNEELCELAAVCAKFPRYTDPHKARTELHSAAVDEVADVMIILDHIISIFQLDDKEIWDRIEGKVDRITRWLSASDSQEQTTVDRAVHVGNKQHTKCGTCDGYGDFQNLKPGNRCCVCVTSGYSQYKPKQTDNKVAWSKPEPCPVTPEQFEIAWEDSDGDDS